MNWWLRWAGPLACLLAELNGTAMERERGREETVRSYLPTDIPTYTYIYLHLPTQLHPCVHAYVHTVHAFISESSLVFGALHAIGMYRQQ